MAKASDFLICCDDGHGMLTAGKRTPFIPELGRYIPENEFNRAVCAELIKELKRCGFRTLETSPGDFDHSLDSRVKRANDAKGDLFISIHYNALDGKFDGEGKDPEGFSAHIDPSGGRSETFAKIALKHLANGTIQKNRGVVKQQLYVTANTKMPAVLFELGFMDNNREARLMVVPSFQKECAQEIAMAVCEFYGVSYVPVAVKPQIVAPPKSAVKIGTAKTLQDVTVYARPEFGTQTGSTLKKGQVRNIYAMKTNGWYQLFSGEWIPSNYGKNFTYEASPTKKPKPSTKEMRRVIVDGKQIGAFQSDDSIIRGVTHALEEKAKNIRVEKVEDK